MRASAPLRAQPQAQAQAQPSRLPQPDAPTRKIFNCIVDDTAFLAGVKKSTRDGIRKWINNGAMRLFVPLFTLEHVDRVKKAGGKAAVDATEALQWLDDVTSLPEVQTAGLVQLQGGEEVYTTWDQVESFLLPETLLSMTESADELDELAEELNNSFHSQSSTDKVSESSVEATSKTSESPRSAYSSTSPDLLHATPYKTATSLDSETTTTRSRKNSARNSKEMPKNKSVVPAYLRPFFNHIIWRIHHEQNPDISPESFILLTNDPKKQLIAQRFSVRAKRLEQMRDIIGREERDFRNRQAWVKREEKGESPVEAPKSDDEDEVVFKRATVSKPKAGQQQVFDPNDFARSHHVTAPTAPAASAAPRGGGRGGRGGMRGGRGNFAPAAPSAPRGAPSPAPRNVEANGPIDPDSFARPPPATRSLRGGRRKLWEPA